MSYAAAARAITEASTIALTTHRYPDADGLGSCLALADALTAMGKTVRLYCPSRIAAVNHVLPGCQRFKTLSVEHQAKRQPASDLLISCDCGDLARLGAASALKRTVLLNLDHHASNDRFGDINVVDLDAAATGVVVDKLLKRLKHPLNQTIATCLYAALVFDTGRFMHSNTSASVFRFAARLLATGIDAATINRKLTYTRTRHDLAITGLGIEHLVIDDDERLAGMALSAPVIKDVGEPEDWGELVDVPRSLAGVEIAYLVREQQDQKTCRISLRSNPPYTVEPVAKLFGGGGHLQAAGATAEGDLASVMAILLPALRDRLADVDAVDGGEAANDG